jgi:hypothetical protein
MTWNVENLFRPGGMAGVTDPLLYEQKLVNMASMIAAHRPGRANRFPPAGRDRGRADHDRDQPDDRGVAATGDRSVAENGERDGDSDGSHDAQPMRSGRMAII